MLISLSFSLSEEQLNSLLIALVACSDRGGSGIGAC